MCLYNFNMSYLYDNLYPNGIMALNRNIGVNIMDGKIIVTYNVLCKSDLNKNVSLVELLLNEKVLKVIKSEFAKGLRNIELSTQNKDASLKIATIKEEYTFEVSKDDFADILVLAEEDASARKLFKKDCDRVELINIETLDITSN